jgi:hypothetical protein
LREFGERDGDSQRPCGVGGEFIVAAVQFCRNASLAMIT